MLIAFSLENYKSFKDRQTLNFTTALGDEHLDHIEELPNGLRVSKIAAVIGGNGAGKSQLIEAILKLSEVVRNDKLDDMHSPHILNKENISLPTSFEIIIADSLRVNFIRYGISVLHKKIVEEYLYSRPIKKGAKESCVFYRNAEKLEFKNEYKRQEKLITPVIKDTGSIIFFNKALDIEELSEVHRWGVTTLNYSPENHKNFGLSFVEKQLGEAINSYANKNNSDLAELTEDEISEKKYVDYFMEEYNTFIVKSPLNIDGVTLELDETGDYHFVYFILDNHGLKNNIDYHHRNSFFSQGTLNVLAFFATILWANSFSFTLYVDEIDSSIHYSLANSLLKLVITKACLLKNSQFIFTTHNIQLIDECMRRDELNIIYKDETRASKIFNASKFSVRKDAKLSAKYFRGEFGAIPSFMNEKG